MNNLTAPKITELPLADHPVIPSEPKVNCLLELKTFESSPNCPVIIWNDYTYYAFRYVDNRVVYVL